MKKKILFFIMVLVVGCLLYISKYKQMVALYPFCASPHEVVSCEQVTFDQPSVTQPYEVKSHEVDAASVPASLTGVTIVFDLHGVLLDVDVKKAFGEIGLSSIFKYTSARNISFSAVEHELTAKVYEILDAIEPMGSDNEILDSRGNRMPALMYDWQRGYKGNHELKSLVLAAMDDHPEWFTSDIEKRLVSQIMVKMFTPEQLIATVKIVPESLNFVKKCKKEGHALMILSNWDAESFECLRNKWPEFFGLFDAIVISGVTHKVKPKQEAFTFLVERKKRLGEDIIVVDDQQENIDAARAAGLYGVWCEAKADFLGFTSTPDISSVKKQIFQIIEKR